MAIQASKLGRDYGGMDPRVARDILANKPARAQLDTVKISELTSWQDVGYWPDQDKVVWDLFEAGEQTVSGISSVAGIEPVGVRQSLGRLQQAGYISHVQEDEEVEQI